MPSGKPRGRLELAVRDPDGTIRAQRRARNMVVRNGAAVIARLFAGTAGALPINRIQLGFAREAASADLQALTPPPGDLPLAAVRSALNSTSFQIDTSQADAVQVSISAVFHATADLDGVTEAGLMAGDDLYNEVVFEPLSLKAGQDVTFFWRIDFPFGH